MKHKVFGWTLRVAAVVGLGVGTGALAQIPDHVKFHGAINEITPASTGGPWEVHGHWSLSLKGRYERADCKADFSAALTMERSDLGVIQNGGGDLNNPMDRMAHTHHITLVDGEVTTVPGGFQVTGPATVTADGVFPPPFGSDLPTVTVTITGATGEHSVPFSNVTVLFGDPAAKHFGTPPLHGVVARNSDKR
jgi:hypothetical protein